MSHGYSEISEKVFAGFAGRHISLSGTSAMSRKSAFLGVSQFGTKEQEDLNGCEN